MPMSEQPTTLSSARSEEYFQAIRQIRTGGEANRIAAARAILSIAAEADDTPLRRRARSAALEHFGATVTDPPDDTEAALKALADEAMAQLAVD